MANVARAFAGEKLQDADVDAILKFTGTEEDLDGNIKYEGTQSMSLSAAYFFFGGGVIAPGPPPLRRRKKIGTKI